MLIRKTKTEATPRKTVKFTIDRPTPPGLKGTIDAAFRDGPSEPIIGAPENAEPVGNDIFDPGAQDLPAKADALAAKAAAEVVLASFAQKAEQAYLDGDLDAIDALHVERRRARLQKHLAARQLAEAEVEEGRQNIDRLQKARTPHNIALSKKLDEIKALEAEVQKIRVTLANLETNQNLALKNLAEAETKLDRLSKTPAEVFADSPVGVGSRKVVGGWAG